MANLIKLNLEQPSAKPGEKRSGMFGDPATPLTAVAVWSELDGGPTASGEMVSERTAMAISTVYTCVTVISEAVASLPCRLMRSLDKGQEEANDHYLHDLLAYSPNPEMTAFSFWQTIIGCSALTGNGYAEIKRLADGSVDSIWPLHPLKTEPVRQSDGSLAFRTSQGIADGTYRIIKSADVLHFPLFGLDGIKGVGPVSTAREAFALAKAAEKFGGRWFSNGAHAPSILIGKTDSGEVPSPTEQREFRETWNSQYGGVNANRQAILFGNWDVKTVGLSPEDSQFLGTRNYQRADIAAMFHLQPHQVGDTGKLSNANYVQAQLSFVTDCLRPIIIRIEQEVKRKLLTSKGLAPTNLFLTFDLSDRLRGDFQSQVQSYSSARQWGYLSVNEIREDMGLNPIGAEGDVYLQPVNMMDAELYKTTKPTVVQPVNAEPQPDDPQPTPKKKAKKK
jgi:HK97 family phage portal protein